MNQNYPTDVDSILQKHPAIAAGQLPVLANVLNLGGQIVAGQPINPQNVQEAERTARLLEELGGTYSHP